jgi:hypothetical protein
MKSLQLYCVVCVGLSALVGPAFAAAPVHSGSFTLVHPMKQFRRQQTATLLLDGKVLVVGGEPFIQAATSELYNPVSASWTDSGPLTTGRTFHTATLLQDGRVAVTGGQTASQLLRSTEIYDPLGGRWTAGGDLNQARELHTATLLKSGVILVAGGFENISSAEEFDPNSGEWKPTASMNVPRYDHTATRLTNGLVLVTGGLVARDRSNDSPPHSRKHRFARQRPGSGCGRLCTGRHPSFQWGDLRPNRRQLGACQLDARWPLGSCGLPAL